MYMDIDKLKHYYKELAQGLSPDNRKTLLNMLQEIKNKVELAVDDIMPIRINSGNLANWKYLNSKVLGYEDENIYTTAIVPYSQQFEFLMLFKKALDDYEPTLKMSYYLQSEKLEINNKDVPLSKGLRRKTFLKILLSSSRSARKSWSVDEIAEKIDGPDVEIDKKYKNRFYQLCDGLVKHIAKHSGVQDVLVFDTNYVQINPLYQANLTIKS